VGHPTAQLVTQGLHAANQCLTMQQAVPDPPDQSDTRISMANAGFKSNLGFRFVLIFE